MLSFLNTVPHLFFPIRAQDINLAQLDIDPEDAGDNFTAYAKIFDPRSVQLVSEALSLRPPNTKSAFGNKQEAAMVGCLKIRGSNVLSACLALCLPQFLYAL